ncbi:MAG: hypothetical protein ABI927_08060 [Gaiellaceae bacterium]
MRAVLGVCDLAGEENALALASRVDSGRIEGVDVSGLGVALVVSSIGRETKWRAVIHIEDVRPDRRGHRVRRVTTVKR